MKNIKLILFVICVLLSFSCCQKNPDSFFDIPWGVSAEEAKKILSDKGIVYREIAFDRIEFSAEFFGWNPLIILRFLNDKFCLAYAGYPNIVNSYGLTEKEITHAKEVLIKGIDKKYGKKHVILENSSLEGRYEEYVWKFKNNVKIQIDFRDGVVSTTYTNDDYTYASQRLNR